MDRGCGEGEADCHASDVGHWLAMTGGGRRVTASGGRTPPLQRDRKCGAWLDGGVRAPRPTRGMEVRHKREGQNPAPTHGSRGRRAWGGLHAWQKAGAVPWPRLLFHSIRYVISGFSRCSRSRISTSGRLYACTACGIVQNPRTMISRRSNSPSMQSHMAFQFSP